jgi:hypothetical protein
MKPGGNEFAGGSAGIRAPEGTTLALTSAAGDGGTSGVLSVTGGWYAAGIGGGETRPKYAGLRHSSGNIYIRGGVVCAASGGDSAGVGGAGAGNTKGAGGSFVGPHGPYNDAGWPTNNPLRLVFLRVGWNGVEGNGKGS